VSQKRTLISTFEKPIRSSEFFNVIGRRRILVI